MAESSGAPNGRKPPKLTIEEYLQFIDTDERRDLTVDHLNQIVYMHGFKMFKKTHKNALLELLSKMELMDPAHSTIEDDGVTSDAILSLEDVIKDLNELKWQECCITTIQTINAVSHHQHDSLDSGGCSVGTIVSASSEKQPRKPGRKPKKLKGVDDVEKENIPPRLMIESSETLPSTPMLENWSPGRKRKVKYAKAMGRGVRVTSNGAMGEVQCTPGLENWGPRKKKTVNYGNGGCGVGVAPPVAAGEVQQSSSAVVGLDA